MKSPESLVRGYVIAPMGRPVIIDVYKADVS
jgi:hypothetical protein